MTSWKNLNSIAGLDALIKDSQSTPQLIFKHSTQCSLSERAHMILMDDWQPEGIALHYIDLLSHRDVSNAVAEKLDVMHESPQIILLYKGEVLFDESHLAINTAEIDEQIEALKHD